MAHSFHFGNDCSDKFIDRGVVWRENLHADVRLAYGAPDVACTLVRGKFLGHVENVRGLDRDENVSDDGKSQFFRTGHSANLDNVLLQHTVNAITDRALRNVPQPLGYLGARHPPIAHEQVDYLDVGFVYFVHNYLYSCLFSTGIIINDICVVVKK